MILSIGELDWLKFLSKQVVTTYICWFKSKNWGQRPRPLQNPKKGQGCLICSVPTKSKIHITPWAKMKYHKSAVIPIFKLNLSRYESDLSNEVLCSLVAQRNVELLKIKVEVWKKKWSYLTPVHTFSSRPWFVRWFFPDLQIWPTAVLQPFELQGCTVPQLKDLIHICLDLA